MWLEQVKSTKLQLYISNIFIDHNYKELYKIYSFYLEIKKNENKNVKLFIQQPVLTMFFKKIF